VHFEIGGGKRISQHLSNFSPGFDRGWLPRSRQTGSWRLFRVLAQPIRAPAVYILRQIVGRQSSPRRAKAGVCAASQQNMLTYASLYSLKVY
jgi:hypothetical protein